MIVVDTNIIAYFFLNGKYTASAEDVYKKDSHWAAPFLWRSEFRNILALYVKQKIITLDDALQIMQKAEQLMKGNEYMVVSHDVLRLAGQSDCSAFDCEFVILARELALPLVTKDKKILDSFPQTAIGLEHFLD